MATTKTTSKKAAKKTAAKKSSSQSKSKRIVQSKMADVMDEFKHHELKSGPGGKAGTVRNPKQAIAIGLSEARKAGGDVPPPPKRAKKTGKK